MGSAGTITVAGRGGGMDCSGSRAGPRRIRPADATVTYVCVNKGGKNPSAQNKTTISGPVSATGTFSSGKNGQVTASLTVDPPGPGSFTCPGGQSLKIAQVTYTNVVLKDTTNNVSISVGDFDSGCLLPDVRDAC